MSQFNISISFVDTIGENTINEIATTYSGDAGDTVSFSIPSLYPSHDGYIFLGWTDDYNADSTKYYDGTIDEEFSEGDTYTFSAYVSGTIVNGAYVNGVTLRAVYEPIIRTLTFNTNGGTGGPSTFSYHYYASFQINSHNFVMPSETPTKQNCDFIGWTKDISTFPDTRNYTAGATYNTNIFPENTTLYAVFYPKKTTPIAPAAIYLGQTVTISLPRVSSDLCHSVSVTYGGTTTTIANNAQTSCTWTPPYSIASLNTSGNSIPITINCHTYWGTANKSLGISSAEGTHLLLFYDPVNQTPADYYPAFTSLPTYTNVSASSSGRANLSIPLPGDTIRFDYTLATNAYGATVDSITCTFEGVTQVCPITQSGSVTFNNVITNQTLLSRNINAVFSIVDSRNNLSTITVQVPAGTRKTPSVDFVSMPERSDGDPTQVIINYKYDITPLSNQNAKTVTIGWGSFTSSITAPTPIGSTTITLPNYSGTGSYTIPYSFGLTSAYVVSIYCSDSLGNSLQHTANIPKNDGIVIDISNTDGTIALHGLNPDDGEDHIFAKSIVLEKAPYIGTKKMAVVPGESFEFDFVVPCFYIGSTFQLYIPTQLCGNSITLKNNSTVSFYKADGTQIFTGTVGGCSKGFIEWTPTGFYAQLNPGSPSVSVSSQEMCYARGHFNVEVN